MKRVSIGLACLWLMAVWVVASQEERYVIHVKLVSENGESTVYHSIELPVEGVYRKEADAMLKVPMAYALVEEEMVPIEFEWKEIGVMMRMTLLSADSCMAKLDAYFQNREMRGFEPIELEGQTVFAPTFRSNQLQSEVSLAFGRWTQLGVVLDRAAEREEPQWRMDKLNGTQVGYASSTVADVWVMVERGAEKTPSASDGISRFVCRAKITDQRSGETVEVASTPLKVGERYIRSPTTLLFYPTEYQYAGKSSAVAWPTAYISRELGHTFSVHLLSVEENAAMLELSYSSAECDALVDCQVGTAVMRQPVISSVNSSMPSMAFVFGTWFSQPAPEEGILTHTWAFRIDPVE